jgi:hypothetical protein
MQLVNFTPLVPTEMGAWWIPELIVTFAKREKKHFLLPRIELGLHKVTNDKAKSAFLFISSAHLNQSLA